MNKPKHTIYAVVDTVQPKDLVTLKEYCSNQKVGVSEERLLELLSLGYLPHYKIDDKDVLVRRAEINNWIRENLVEKSEGMKLPTFIRTQSILQLVDNVPKELKEFGSSLRGMDLAEDRGSHSCIYFLYDDDELTYVGQTACNAYNRINDHKKTKMYTKAYYIPCPKSELDHLEQSLIKHFKPRDNKSHNPEWLNVG